jgi:hypothetical protein
MSERKRWINEEYGYLPALLKQLDLVSIAQLSI